MKIFLRSLKCRCQLHRQQVERELRTSVIRLRQAFLSSRGRRAELAELMIASASTFATLFRHSLIALGETPPDSRREAARPAGGYRSDSIRRHFTPCSIFGKGSAAPENSIPSNVFAAYLDVAARVAEEMDRRLARA